MQNFIQKIISFHSSANYSQSSPSSSVSDCCLPSTSLLCSRIILSRMGLLSQSWNLSGLSPGCGFFSLSGPRIAGFPPKMTLCGLRLDAAFCFLTGFVWPTQCHTFAAVIFSSLSPSIRTGSSSSGNLWIASDTWAHLLFLWTSSCWSLPSAPARKSWAIIFPEWFSWAFLRFSAPFSSEKFHNFSFNSHFFLSPFAPQFPWLCFCRCSVAFTVIGQSGCNTADRHGPFEFRSDFGNWGLGCIVVFIFIFIVFQVPANIIVVSVLTGPAFFALIKVTFSFIFQIRRPAGCMKSCWILVIFTFGVAIFRGAFFPRPRFGTIDRESVWFGFTWVYFAWVTVWGNRGFREFVRIQGAFGGVFVICRKAFWVGTVQSQTWWSCCWGGGFLGYFIQCLFQERSFGCWDALTGFRQAFLDFPSLRVGRWDGLGRDGDSGHYWRGHGDGFGANCSFGRN